MGSGSVLEIGEQPLKQVERYQNEEHAPALSPYMVESNILERARRGSERHDYDKARQFVRWQRPDGRFMRDGTGLTPDEDAEAVVAQCTRLDEPVSAHMSFQQWQREQYRGHGPWLGPDEEPDRAGSERWRWVRADAQGQVIEVIWRHMPDNFYFYIVGGEASMLLKPGRRGTVLKMDRSETEVGSGEWASSALKGDVDWDAMRAARKEEFGKAWDAVHRIAGGRSWASLEEIQAHHPADEQAAHDAWAAQDVVRAVRNAAREAWSLPSSPQGLDPMRQAREPYVAAQLAQVKLLGRCEVVRDGVLLNPWHVTPDPINEAELLASLSDDTRLTCLAYKC